MTRTLPEVARELDTTWLVVAAVLVMFMQAGFACLEIGFSRGKNAGTVVAKILLNFSVASLVWWMVGFGLAFGGGLALFGDSGFFLSVGHHISAGSPIAGTFDAADSGYVLFQLVFCAVSLAIVWGTTLERIRFIAYPIYATVFAGLIYPLVAHWIFGGGWLDRLGAGMQDFAGSTVVHLTGATGGLAALLLLGAAPRQVRARRPAARDPRPLDADLRPRRADPVARLVRLQRRLDDRHRRLALRRDRVRDQPRRRGGRRRRRRSRSPRSAAGSTSAWSATARSARWWRSPRRAGFVELWAAPIIGVVAGALVVVSVLAIDRVLDDPVGALSRPRRRRHVGDPGLRPVRVAADRRRAWRPRRRRPRLQRLVRAARRAGGRRAGDVHARVRPVVSDLRRRSRRPSACASPRSRSARGSTSSSTGCTATPSSSWAAASSATGRCWASAGQAPASAR